MLRSRLARSIVFVVVFLGVGAGAIEVYARVAGDAYPALDVVTGVRVVAPASPPAGERPNYRILWLSSSEIDAEKLLEPMRNELNVTLDVVQRGHTEDSLFDLSRRLVLEGKGIAPDLVVLDMDQESAASVGDVNAFVLDDNGRIQRRIAPHAFDPVAASSRAYAIGRMLWASRVQCAAPDLISIVREDAVGLNADPVFVSRKSSRTLDDKLAPARFVNAKVPAGDTFESVLSSALVDHIRERTFLLRTSAARAVLPDTLPQREQFALAARALGTWTIDLAGSPVGAAELQILADTPADKSLTRAAREQLRRPVHVTGLLSFLDDVLTNAPGMFRGRPVVLTPSRARRVHLFVHPDEVFQRRMRRRNRPRVYPVAKKWIPITEPKEPEGLVVARNGDVLGAGWYLRFPNPETEEARMRDLTKRNRRFGRSVQRLVSQLRAQGAEVSVDSTVRAPQRGYLMWGAFHLSRAKTPLELEKRATTLDAVNKKWKLNIDIQWRHPDGFNATIRAAQEMADTYGVVYATKRGAEKSDHYEGKAADISAVGLPSRLTLRPYGRRAKTFDLSGDEESRDLSVTPELVSYIERAFRMKKLKGDYPHWSAR